MTSLYEGSAGRVLLEYKGGVGGARNEQFTIFGRGTEREVLSARAQNLINGVTQFETGAAANNSVGLSTPLAWRGAVEENGVKREANGPLVAKLRAGFPSLDSSEFFFGIVDQAVPSSGDLNVGEILTAIASGQITSVFSDFAGFYRNSLITASPNYWRTVAINQGGGEKNGAVAPVLTKKQILAAQDYMNVSPVLSPTLEINVVHDGTVEFYYNGEIVRRADKGINPEQNYAVLFCQQTQNASRSAIGVDYMCVDFQRYYGPIFT